MKPRKLPPPVDANEEISALIEVLHKTEQRLDELTAGEVDSVTDRHGQTFLLHRAQEQSREREAAKQAAILNALPAHIALLDAQGQILSVNEAWQQFGRVNAAHGPGHEIGVNYLTVCDQARGVDSTEAREAAAGIRSVLSGETKHFSLEYPCHSPTRQRWFLMTVTPLSDERPNGAVVMHLNVTAEKQSKESLTASELRFRQMADNITDVFWVTSPDLKIMHYVSPAYQLIWGRSTESLYVNPHQWIETILPEDRDRVFAVFATLMDNEPKVSVEYRVARPDGTVRWVCDRGFQVRDDAGNLVRLTGIVTDITERKLIEETLQRKQTELRVLFDLMPAMIWFKDTENGILRVNKRVAEAAGKSVEEIEGKPSIEIYPLQASKYHADDLEVIHSGAPKLGIIETLPGPDGREHWVQTDKVPYRNKDGKVIGIVVMAQDVTERKRATEAVQRSQKHLRGLIDGLGPSMFVGLMTPQGILIESNRSALAAADLKPEDVLGKPFEETYWWSYSPEVQQQLREAIALAARGKACRFDVQILAAGNQLIDADFSLQPVWDETGEVVFLVPSASIITERKRMEIALRASEMEFRTMAEAMPQIVWITRADGWNTYFNQHWVDYTGLTLEQSLGHGWNKPFHPDDQQRAWDAWQHATTKIATYSIESRLQRADGVYRWWLVRGVPQLDADGNILKWFGTCTDIHDMKMTELEVTHSNQALRKSETRIKYLNRVYAMLSGINTLIARVQNRDELFWDACRIAVESGGFRMSLICIQDSVTMKIVPVASAGKDEAFMNSIKTLLSSSEVAQNTMVARSIREGKVIVSNDPKNDPQVMLSKQYIESGVHSIAVFPLIVADEVIGVMALYASESEFFHKEELKLLTSLTEDIAFGIDHIGKKERLDYLAYYDVLTGLPNRTLFHQRLEQAVIDAQQQDHKLALVLLDLERFKVINDSLGRPAGDALLKAVAARMLSYSKDVNRVARIDADHFAVMVLDVQSTEELARLIEQRITEIFSLPYLIGDSELRLAVKFGVAMSPADGDDADTLFRNAEVALKNAKKGGERYLFYSPAMSEHTAEKLLLENQLRQAIEKNEFVLHYQPKINLVSGEVTSAEALIRWNDPRTGLVPPGRFIPVLEETGMIYEVGRWALRQAIADYLRWRKAGLPAVRIAVNVSPLQLRDRGFVSEISRVIAIDAHAAAGLELEITESLIMDDVKLSIASLQTIRDMGVTIAIDDFGTGFSSLSYLAKLPVHTLKIDRSFVIDMTAGPLGLALVSTIVNLAHSLKLKVVAEGVETEEQSRLLRLLNCDEIQGYLFSKPVPTDIFEAKFLASPSKN